MADGAAATIFEGEFIGIVVVANDDDTSLSVFEGLCPQAKVVARGPARRDAFKDEDLAKGHIICRCDGDGLMIETLLPAMPKLKWIHTRSNGCDSMLKSQTIRDGPIPLTNSKGAYSRTLAEYSIGAFLYFAKDMPRLLAQQKNKEFTKFPMRELHKATMGVIGYGDIGRATAKLAKAFGMRVIGTRRRPELSKDDEFIDECFGASPSEIASVMQQSDYVLVATALTPQTRGLVNKGALESMKNTAVLVNVSRGPIIDEDALLHALQTNQIRGAALDVFCQEPLPDGHAFYDLPNLLMSPHNADITETFRHEALELFVANVNKFAGTYFNEPGSEDEKAKSAVSKLSNVVDKQWGY